MKIFYMDNFRGFKKTFIELKDVNFFVGENSTGKTSVLALLKLLSSAEMFFKETLDATGFNFGNFDDIVSIYSEDRSYFRVGFISEPESEEEEQENPFNAVLMTFVEEQGMPKISQYSFVTNGHIAHIEITRKRIKYKISKRLSFSSVEDFIKNEFSNWINEHSKKTTGYRYFKPKMTADYGNRLIEIHFLVHSLIRDDKNSYKGVRIPGFAPEIVWLAPIRSKPRRTYDEFATEYSPEGEHTPYLIKKILNKKSEAIRFEKFLKNFGQESGLFDRVSIVPYGKSSASPFELDVVLNDKALNISNVGYGVSQSLPVVVEIFFRNKGTWFAVQQPEVHLHPRAQACLGEIFFEISLLDHKVFLIETHSDYTIDRFRLAYKRHKGKTKPISQILFFERTKDGNKIHHIQISDKGELSENQPQNYREFFIREEMKLLDL